jgi:5,10-methylenetetrahydromethanopterin reductase
MQLAISFGGYYESVKKYVDAAKYCETHGAHSIWLADSQMIHRDIYEALALCAIKTKRVKLGTAVTNPVTRDQTVTACAVSTLEEISNDRAILGIGPGDSSVRRIDSRPAKVADLRDAVSRIRRICSGETFPSKTGEELSMRWSRHRVPIFISATGPKMLALAGEIGDGVIMNVGTGEKAVKNALKRINSVEHRNKDFKVADLSFVHLSEDRKTAINEARSYVVWYLKNARYLFSENGLSTASKESEFNAKYLVHDHIHSDAPNFGSEDLVHITDEMVDKFTIAGTPEDCLRKLREKEKAGIDIFIARHTGESREWERFLRMYFEAVVEKFA